MLTIFQTIFAALIITASAWLSKKYPSAAGLLIALPLASMLVLPFSYWQHGEAETSVKLAREIFKAIPVSVTFFIPFALSERLGLDFWQCYGVGIGLLAAVFFLVKGFTGANF